MHLKPISPRALTASSYVAFALIACLSVASHALLTSGLREGEGSAAIVDIAARQAMLSQRIAALAARYRLGDSAVRDDLASSIDAFQSAHDILALRGAANPAGDDAARQLGAVYFAADDGLDSLARGFIADARRVADLPPDDPALPGLLARIFAASHARLLTQLDKVVTIQQTVAEHGVETLMRMQWGILATVLATLLIKATLIVRPMCLRLVAHASEMLLAATTDKLTGAANRRAFMDRCGAEIARARRYHHPASLLMMDIDQFGAITQTHGRDAGDAVLTVLGDALRQSLRQSDILGRLGGEAFAIMLTETELAGATLLAERLRRQCTQMRVRHRGRDVGFTVSIGVASVPKRDDALAHALGVAKNLLDVAKESGRNCVVSDALSGVLA